jgi:hypothetical protein
MDFENFHIEWLLVPLVFIFRATNFVLSLHWGWWIGGLSVAVFIARWQWRVSRRHKLALAYEASHANSLAERQLQEAVRDEWLCQNTLQLYFNAIGGLIAVMTPRQYAECTRITDAQRVDGRWESQTVLVPWLPTVLFATDSAYELCGPSMPKWVERPFLVSHLTQLQERYNIHMVHKVDIFVPYVNEALAPFDEHKSNSSPLSPRQLLIYPQLPSNLHPF